MKKKANISRREFLVTASIAATGLFTYCTPKIMYGDKKPIVRFGLIADTHYADREPTGTRFYNQSIAKVKEFIELMNQKKVDFVIELGDYKDQDLIPNEANTLKYLSDIESVFQTFNGPTYHVLGNHDMDSISKRQFLERVENTGIPVTKSYYSFDLNRIHFIVLDGNFTKDGKEYDSGNFRWQDSFIPASQLNWLKEDMKSNEHPTIVFIHQMLDEQKRIEQAVQNFAEVRKVLEQFEQVLCVFQGHVHEERYNYINGIHYYSVNAAIEGDGIENNAYQVVSVYENGNILIDGFRRASDRKFAR